MAFQLALQNNWRQPRKNSAGQVHVLSATPDSITDDMVIEIKRQIAPFKLGIETALNQGKIPSMYIIVYR